MERPSLARQNQARFDLRRLIHPVDLETFKRDYWERQPLILQRNNPDYYQGLLSLHDVDNILSSSSITSSISSDQIRVLRDGDDIPLLRLNANRLYGSVGMLEPLYAEYRAGATIVLQFLHERWKPLMQLCQSLARTWTAAFQVNAYLTPSTAQGLKTHYDTHDVFVLQTEGSKHWRIYGSPTRLPLAGQSYDSDTHGESGDASQEFDLQKGDLIYIPRGYLHDAVATDTVSLHLTVGILQVSWATVLLNAVESVIERDARFRESLPPGFATDEALKQEAKARFTDLLVILREQIDPSITISEVAKAALGGIQPHLDRHLLDLEAQSQVTLETWLRRRPEILYSLALEDGNVCLYFHSKVVRMPSHVEAELRFIAEADQFRGGDLPGDLDDPGRLVLIRRLLREGFLTTSLPLASTAPENSVTSR